MEELYLILGCFGNIDDGFINCRACENRILLINPKLFYYNEILDYLDNCGLFDKAIFDLNAIRNIIRVMQDKFEQVKKRLWHEKEYKKFDKFIQVHRDCGLYLKLELNKQISENSIIEEKTVPIINKEPEFQKPNLPFIRGRR